MRNEIVLLILFLTGCATSPISTVVLQPDVAVAVPETQPLTLNPVQWQVMTLDQLKKIVAQMKASKQQQAIIFALDSANYNNLSLNLIEIQRYIEEQKAILTMLKNIIAERAAASSAAQSAATNTTAQSAATNTMPTGKH